MTKKILFLNHEMVIGGAEGILINYLNIAASNPNYEVHLALFQSIEKQNIDRIDPRVDIEYLVTPAEDQFARYTYWKTQDQNILEKDKHYYRSWHDYIVNERQERLLNKINKENYDVIIDFLNTFGYFLKKEFLDKIKKPSIYWIHASRDFDIWLSKKEYYKSVLSHHSLFVSICEDMKRKSDIILKNELDLQEKETINIFNPVNIPEVIEMSNQEPLEGDQKLLDDDFILQVARLYNANKNHTKMIDIFYKLKQKGIKEKLYIIGDGPSRKELEDKIKELGLENECLLLGSRINPFPFMKRAKLFLHTSNFEGLPTVFIESMICGTPVVAFNCPTGPREILADGKYGELIPMGDEDLFVEKTYELLTNEEKRQHFISLLPQSYQRFSMEKISEQFFQLIEDVTRK
ncbi:CDP-glycerol:glycerophosphate [Actinobacillus porcinus]|uniref:CDP-glycerol:glycerophosphate n=1 Tax=Actinobacillus porcinus TaxID=51048 RepID=A0ABY6TI69_9PAST|nr:glycosyltransferase [Actinobacillus porcinus]VFY92588.1 CDP-glycerol:glycerophosphate [Actinobacillus porcinus]VTU06849.1 CDP-glycerol:glycerophosphate [Actinobacillus porcinus]